MKVLEQTNQKHIVVVGGGFAGVDAAISLRKKKHRVTLISNRDYFFIYPISIWIPVSKIKFSDSTLSLSRMAQKYGFELIVDVLETIIPNEKQVVLKNQKISFDYLIIATGASKMKHKGLEHTFSICGQPEQSVAMQHRFNELLQHGKGKIAVGFGGNPKDKSGVRGGPAFEILFNFVHILKQQKLKNQFELTFFAPMEEPGKRMGKSGFKMLDVMLEKENIQKRVGKKITEFTANSIQLEDGSSIESDLTMFIAASTGQDIWVQSELPTNEAGFIKIDDHCQVEGWDSIYAIGDVAAIEGPEWIAKQGHMAVVMGKNAAYNIDQHIKDSMKRKGYQKHLNILCVMDTGNGAAFIYRKNDFDMVIPMPIVGHWLKKAWGWHFKLTH